MDPTNKEFNLFLYKRMMNECQGMLKKHKTSWGECGIPHEDFKVAVAFFYVKIIDKKQFAELFEKMIVKYASEYKESSNKSFKLVLEGFKSLQTHHCLGL